MRRWRGDEEQEGWTGTHKRAMRAAEHVPDVSWPDSPATVYRPPAADRRIDVLALFRRLFGHLPVLDEGEDYGDEEEE